MKIKNKAIGFLLILSLVPGIFGHSLVSTSYADTASTANTFENQKRELQRAVDDSVKVVNSEVYFSYASQGLKTAYENAISDGQLQLAREDATYEDLRLATKKINEAKAAIYNEAAQSAKNIQLKKQLEQSIRENKLQANVAQSLLDNYPKTVKKIRPKLLNMLKVSTELISEAEALLKTL